MGCATIVEAAAPQPARRSRVVGGALAKLALRQLGISVQAYTSQVGPLVLTADYHDLEFVAH